MALKNKHHNFWTLWNFSGLWYSLTTACCRYFCRDLESYVNGNDWKWQIFLLCFPLERGQGAKQSNSYLMLIALYSPMQGDTLPSQRTNVSRRTIAHTLFPVVREACASSPSFPSQNDPRGCCQLCSPCSCLPVVLSSASAGQLEGEQHFRNIGSLLAQNPEADRQNTELWKPSWPGGEEGGEFLIA